MGGTATGSKGIIACDNAGATTLPNRTGKPYITTFNNYMPTLRPDYSGWTTDNNVAYNNTVITIPLNYIVLFYRMLLVETQAKKQKTSFYHWNQTEQDF